MGQRDQKPSTKHRAPSDADLDGEGFPTPVEEHVPLVVIHEEPEDQSEGKVNVQDNEEDEKLTKKKKKSGKRKTGGTIVFLNGLRGLAALLVVGDHGGYFHGVKVAGFGVDCFFVLSSFLLTMIFERKARQMLKQGANVRQWLVMLADYFSKRFFRVYPLFAIVATIFASLPEDVLKQYLPMHGAKHYNLFNVLTFKRDSRYFVFWSLPVEIGYYFLIPVFVAVMLALKRKWWILTLPTFVWIIHDRKYWYQFTRNHQPLVAHLSTFIIGSFGAFIYGRINEWIQETGFEFSKWQRLIIQAVEWAVAAVLLYCALNEDMHAVMMGNGLLAVYTVVIMVIELVIPSPISRLFEWNFLVYSGKISFSMYLLHCFAIYTHVHVGKYHRFLFDFGFTCLLSTASYWMFEYPSQLGAQRVSKWLSGFNGAGQGTEAPAESGNSHRSMCSRAIPESWQKL